MPILLRDLQCMSRSTDNPVFNLFRSQAEEIDYQILSLWYDSTGNLTTVSRTDGEYVSLSYQSV